MKYWLLFLAVQVSGLFCPAQNSVISISATDPGARFYVVLNGIQQNGMAGMSVELKDLKPQPCTLMISFAVQDISPVVKKFDLNAGTLFEFSIVRADNAAENSSQDSLSSNGMYKLVLVSEKPLENDYIEDANAGNVYLYDEYMKINGGNETVSQQTNSGNNNTYTDDNVYEDVSSNSITVTNNINENSTSANVYYGSGYTGKTGCLSPMAESDFQAAKQSVSSRDFEDSKLGVAKQVATNNCLYASQVKDLMKLFSFEDTRLEFAKFAWAHTYDVGNYFMVNDAFDFESSSKELDEYINRK